MIKVDLVAGLNEAWDVGFLPEHFKEGLIFLIPKVQGTITRYNYGFFLWELRVKKTSSLSM